MLSPVQLNTSAHRPIRSARGPIPVRFGGDKNKPVSTSSIDIYESSGGGLFNKEKAEAFSAAIKGLHDFGPDKEDDYYDYNFAEKYQELTQRGQKHYNAFQEMLKPEDLEKMKKANELGVVEEASDMDFEAFTLRALRQKVFTDKMVKKWANDVLPDSTKSARHGKTFDQFMDEVDHDIPKEKADKLAKEMGWDPQKAHKMLLLMGAKFTLMRSRDYKYELWDANKKLLMGEEEELRETFSRFSPRKAQIWLLAAIYTHIPGLLSLEKFQSQLQGIVSGRLNTKQIKNEDLLENVFAKQFRRQEFDYQNPQFKDKRQRKQVLKGFEVLNEAAILKNAKDGHPKEIVAF